MKKEILFVLLNEFADTESAYIASLLNFGLEPGKAKYTVKTLSVTKEPIVSMGGFRVLPDYDLQDVPDDYAGLVLIGKAKKYSDCKITRPSGKLFPGFFSTESIPPCK